MGRITNQRKIPKWLPFQNYKSESLNILCAHMGGHMCICILNTKFLCLTMCWGVLCKDDDAGTNDANTNANNGQNMIEKALWLKNQMSQKYHQIVQVQ